MEIEAGPAHADPAPPPCRVSHDEGESGDVTGNDGPGAHQCVGADRETRHHDRASPQCRPFSDDGPGEPVAPAIPVPGLLQSWEAGVNVICKRNSGADESAPFDRDPVPDTLPFLIVTSSPIAAPFSMKQ